MPALYLALTIMTAVKEINQGFAHKIEPCVLCSYDIDCEDVVDLRDEEGQRRAASLRRHGLRLVLRHFARPRAALMADRAEFSRRRNGWRSRSEFCAWATPADQNLVLWKWGKSLPHKVSVFDPSGRLPKDQLSWK